MSRPFSRIVDVQESGSGNQVSGTGVGGGEGEGNGSGNGVRGWWRNSRGGSERRRESMASNESVPKSPSQGNEMATVGSNFAGLSPDFSNLSPNFVGLSPTTTTTTDNTPTSNPPAPPRARSSSIMFAPQPQPQVLQDSVQPLERPQVAAVRSEMVEVENPVLVEMSQGQAQAIAQARAQAQAQAQGAVDVEAQRTVPQQEGRWWWQRGSMKGLQSKLITVLVAGFFLAITLAIYLGLALANDLKLRHEWHVLLILIILVATMFFCHALVRLCIMATNPTRFQRSSRNFSRIPSVSGPDGYANPREPIRIQTHFEHDVDGVEPDLTKMPPPVYGLWRCSVRVNPNQFYWVRRASAQQSTIPEGREPISPRSGRNNDSTPRPPSYVSEDGVSYALAADTVLPPSRPEPPLPPHPSEVRRVQGY